MALAIKSFLPRFRILVPLSGNSFFALCHLNIKLNKDVERSDGIMAPSSVMQQLRL